MVGLTGKKEQKPKHQIETIEQELDANNLQVNKRKLIHDCVSVCTVCVYCLFIINRGTENERCVKCVKLCWSQTLLN